MDTVTVVRPESLTKAARQRLVAELANHPNAVVADLLGVNPRTIERDRKELGLPSAWATRDPSYYVHGTAAGYNRGCRCAECVAGKQESDLAMKATRLARGVPDGDPRHGTNNGYTNWGCRCEPCKAAKAEVNAAAYARRTGRS